MAMEVNGAGADAAARTGAQTDRTSARQGFFEVFHRLPASRFTEAPSGVQVAVVREGQGTPLASGMRAKVHYTGWLTDGTRFDTSADNGKPFEFTLGNGRVIKGWEEALRGMKPGERRQIIVPPEQAYGERQVGQIPPGSTLVFNVELVAAEAATSPNPKGNHSFTA